MHTSHLARRRVRTAAPVLTLSLTLTLLSSGIADVSGGASTVNPGLSPEPELKALPGEAKRPNIVVILADDLGYGDVSFNPHHPEEVNTPNIDRLAHDGVIFANGYVTSPVCAPTRAGFLTGRNQARFGFYTAVQSRNGLPLNEVTLAQVLGEAGYTSGVFGKWHLGITPQHNPVERGFDEFYGFLGHGGHDYFDLKIDENNLHNAIRRGHKAIDDEGYLTDRITEEAIRFIERNRDQPFFAYVAYSAPHTPLQAPQEYIDNYDTGDSDRDTYLAMVEVMDEGIGRIIQTLKDQGDYENSLIFFLSDNGGARANSSANTPLRGFKQDMYEGGIHVPFVVTWPAELEAGTTSDVPVTILDIFPTATDVAGISVPQDRPIDGKNLLPAARNEVDQLHERLFWVRVRGDAEPWAIQQWPWKRMQDYRDRQKLFDLEHDLGEDNNLLDQQSDLAQELESAYNAWRERMHDPLPPIDRDSDPLGGDEYFSEEYLKQRAK